MERNIEIIPSTNSPTFAEHVGRIRMVENCANWIHLDISDGTMSDYVTWHKATDLIGFKTLTHIEVHLMIAQPEKQIKEWLATPAERIIFHIEATKSHDLLIQKIHEAKKEVGVAIRPDTPWLKLFPYIEKVDMFLLLAVSPGPSGQIFDESIIHKISHLRGVCDPCTIEVDGGVNRENIKMIIDAGADTVVAGNAIFGADDPIKALKALSNLVAK